MRKKRYMIPRGKGKGNKQQTQTGRAEKKSEQCSLSRMGCSKTGAVLTCIWPEELTKIQCPCGKFCSALLDCFRCRCLNEKERSRRRLRNRSKRSKVTRKIQILQCIVQSVKVSGEVP